VKKLILIAMLAMLTACSDENFDGTYVGAQEPSPLLMSATYTLKVTGNKATMERDYDNDVMDLKASVSGDTLAISHPSKMLYFTFTDNKKALRCEECSPKVWKKVKDNKQEKEQEEDSWFQSLIDLLPK